MELVSRVFKNNQPTKVAFYDLSAPPRVKKKTKNNPTNIGFTRGTPSVTTLVVVSDGVTIWVAPRFSHHLYGVRNTRAGVRIVKKSLRATHRLFHPSNIGWEVIYLIPVPPPPPPPRMCLHC